MANTKETVDTVDVKLMQILQKDGRISNARLAVAVNLSPSACFQRVRRLEKRHYITGYNATIATGKLCGTTMTIMTMVKMTSDQIHIIKEFENCIRSSPGIVEWHATLGEHDYILKFLVPTLDRYQAIMQELMTRDVGIKSFTSLVVHKHFAKPPDLASLDPSS